MIRLSCGTVKAWLDSFLNSSMRFGSVTLWCYEDVCQLKAKCEELPSINDRYKKGMQTSLRVALEDLDEYDVQREELLTFPLKEFRVNLSLSPCCGSLI